jgi:cysteinyl-tRNA synthetase
MYHERFTEAMDDDFNTAQAVASLFDLASEINRSADEGHSTEEAQSLLMELAGVLGFSLESRKPTVDISSSIAELAGQFGINVGTDEPQREASDIIELLIEKRTEYRQTREWALADKIRTQLAELGIVLEDTSGGTSWRYNR